MTRLFSRFSSPMKTTPCTGMARRRNASSESSVWLMVPSAVLAHSTSGICQRAKISANSNVSVSGTRSPPAPLDDKRSIRLRRQQQRGIDRDILKAGRQMWRSRHFQAIGLRQDARARHATQPFYRLAVCFFVQPGLHGFPVICLQRVGQRCGKNRLADARVGA
ncbi:hypothetical protein L1887_57657 [Cichorium endivia]|nr:hypothetical protein L1887_57657 [Cichorium endivia]